MNKNKIIIIVIAIVLLIPIIIGFSLPKNRVVEEKALIDKMYYFILSDVTNHWEESGWRSNIDTIMEKPAVDGLDAWMEYYTNGDSILLLTQITAENDYIRIIVDPDGHQRTRSITIIDVTGRTAIRISEEIYTPNPITRIKHMLNDEPQQLLTTYVFDLIEKNKSNGNDDGGW